MKSRLPVGLCAQVACLWEATARKPGNVHRFRDFEDSGYVDFLLSSAAIGAVLERATSSGVGPTILEGVRASREVARTNTNLGILLLLAPMAAVPAERTLQQGIGAVVGSLTLADAKATYEAIRLAAPGGLGRVAEEDVASAPTQDLRQVMCLAASRDLIAAQYANGFADVLGTGLEAIASGLSSLGTLEGVVIRIHLVLMQRYPDTLIARKRGVEEARQASTLAGQVLASGWPDTPAGQTALARLDEWLQAAPHHGRNPGTTADLVAASLFAALREGIMTLPCVLPWSTAETHA